MSETGLMLTVRRAEYEEVEILVDLMQGFYAEAGQALNRISAAASFLKLISDCKLGCVWLARLGNEPVGHAVLTIRFTMEHSALSGYIDDLYVRPAFRRRRIATALLHELVRECQARGCTTVQVEAGSDDYAAHLLYERLGLLSTRDNRILLSGQLSGIRNRTI